MFIIPLNIMSSKLGVEENLYMVSSKRKCMELYWEEPCFVRNSLVNYWIFVVRCTLTIIVQYHTEDLKYCLEVIGDIIKALKNKSEKKVQEAYCD